MKYTQDHIQKMVQECKDLYNYWQELSEEFNATNNREVAAEAVKAHKEYIKCMEHIIFTMLPNMQEQEAEFPAVPYYDEIF